MKKGLRLKSLFFVTDILSDIDREEKNIEYILSKEQESGYTGQTAEQHLKMFMAETEYWN